MTPAEILNKAADLLEPKGAWTQGWFARDKSRCHVAVESSAAVCWCAAGAIERASPPTLYWDALNALARVLPTSIAVWNDSPERTQAEVVAKLREAAAL